MNYSDPSLLRVDSSIHATTSVSRAVADTFEAAWRASAPTSRVVRRELGLTPLPYLTDLEHAAMFIPEEHRSPDHVAAQARAAALADELFDADVILIASPLYNLAVPACLKSWFDHVFTDIRLFPGYGITQPLAGRTAVVVTSRGGCYGPGAPMEGWDYEEPYLRRLLVDILGLQLEQITVELTLAAMSPAMSHLIEAAETSLRAGHESAQRLGQSLALDSVAA